MGDGCGLVISFFYHVSHDGLGDGATFCLMNDGFHGHT